MTSHDTPLAGPLAGLPSLTIRSLQQRQLLPIGVAAHEVDKALDGHRGSLRAWY